MSQFVALEFSGPVFVPVIRLQCCGSLGSGVSSHPVIETPIGHGRLLSQGLSRISSPGGSVVKSGAYLSLVR